MTKYVFVTGGVVSSLGKGLCAASLGTLLELRGLRVTLQKFDPYLNVDPGTMSPYQHGEVYVLSDGAETDLDLGHYERFTRCVLSKVNSTSSGQVYTTVLEKERNGAYLGATVQVIPHITDEIKVRIRALAELQPCDVLITEIGGTTGDIEGLPFLEAIRQFILEVGLENAIIVHVTLVPYIRAAGELKTKPSQQSIAKLREIGLSPQVLICRTEQPLTDETRRKLSIFCSVPLKAVIEARDVDNTIYESPLLMHEEGLDEIVCRLLDLKTAEPDMTAWQRFVTRVIFPRKQTKIAVVGKYIEHDDAYKSIFEALTHAGAAGDCRVDVVKVDAEDLVARGGRELLGSVAGILVPGGFGERGIEGKILAARYARENRVPYLGLCLGMQVAAIEFARNVCGLDGANSTEFVPEPPHKLIDLMEEQKKLHTKGGNMRLGQWRTLLKEGSRAQQVYGQTEIVERHRHRYEFNRAYQERLEEKGMVFSGVSPEGDLVEVIELKDHPFFMACQYHPEFLSKPNQPHPLFRAFIAASLSYSE